MSPTAASSRTAFGVDARPAPRPCTKVRSAGAAAEPPDVPQSGMRRELAPGRGRRSHDDDGRQQVAPSGLTTHPDLLTRRPATAVALQESAGNAAVASRLRAVQRDFASQGYGVKEGGTAHTITRPKQVLHEY